MIARKNSAKIFVALITLLVSGCINLLPPAPLPSKKVLLSPNPSFSSTSFSNPVQISVIKPTVSPTLEFNKILVVNQLNTGLKTADFIADVEWAEPLPQIVHENLLESLEKTHLFKAVGREHDNLKASFLLQTDLRHFEVLAEENSLKEVFIEIDVKVIRVSKRDVIAQQSFSKRQKIKDSTLVAAIDGFNRSFSKILEELVPWLSKQSFQIKSKD
jgi:cholesterol transport system auxiliary component